MRYDIVLYDFDGTLADTVPVILQSFQTAFLEVTGHREDETFLLSTIGLPLTSAFRNYKDPQVFNKLHDIYLRENKKLLADSVRIFEGVEEGLAAVRDMGVRQGIVTSKRRDVALFTIRQFGIEDYFETIITREDTQIHKPNPEPILLAMEKMGITDVSRVLYVGDSIHDLRCAANAGVDSAAVNWTYMPKHELAAEKPAFWLDRLTDLSCILTDAEL